MQARRARAPRGGHGPPRRARPQAPRRLRRQGHRHRPVRHPRRARRAPGQDPRGPAQLDRSARRSALHGPDGPRRAPRPAPRPSRCGRRPATPSTPTDRPRSSSNSSRPGALTPLPPPPRPLTPNRSRSPISRSPRAEPHRGVPLLDRALRPARRGHVPPPGRAPPAHGRGSDGGPRGLRRLHPRRPGAASRGGVPHHGRPPRPTQGRPGLPGIVFRLAPQRA